MPGYADTIDFHGAGNADWYVVANVVRVVRQLKRLNFSVVADRQQALALVNDLAGDAPFAATVQFPAAGYYLSSLDVCVNQYVEQIRAGAQYRDFQKDQADKTNKSGGDSRKDEIVGGGYNDAQRSFNKGIDDLGKACSRRDLLWNRAVFDARYTWS